MGCIYIEVLKISTGASSAIRTVRRFLEKHNDRIIAVVLMLNICSMSIGTRVLAVKNNLARLQLISPMYTSKGEKIALSRRVEKHWRLIGLELFMFMLHSWLILVLILNFGISGMDLKCNMEMGTLLGNASN